MRIESGISRELGPQVSMGPDGLHPRLLTLLAVALVRSLSVTFERPRGPLKSGEQILHLSSEKTKSITWVTQGSQLNLVHWQNNGILQKHFSSMDGTYLNISKAFDTVCCDTLAHKWVLVWKWCLKAYWMVGLQGKSEWTILYLEASNKWSAAGLCSGTCGVSHPYQRHHECIFFKFTPNGCTIQ